MRNVIQHPRFEPVKVNDDRLEQLKGWIVSEIEDALSARNQQEALWRELLRMYEGVPKRPVRNDIIENAPNIEITLGAIAADSIYAQSIDLIYTITPLVTARPTNKDWVKYAKDFQRWTDYVVTNESNVRLASEDTLLDDIQLGTGVYYVPWVETIKKTRSSKVIDSGPKIISIPIEDFIVPGGSMGDIQDFPWVGLRFWYSESEMAMRAKMRGWDISAAIPTGTVGWVRSRREALGRTTENRKIGILYEVIDLYVEYDIDDDGIVEDLLVTWDRSSQTILKLRYQPYDSRPTETMVYQRRGHLFYGIGALEVIRPYQEETTEIHMQNLLNMLIANCRVWKAKSGSVPENMKMWPNKLIEMSDPGDLVGEALGDVYPSSRIAEATSIALAERRVGANEITSRPSQMFGSRTPGITALSALQQTNKRFTPAFDGMRLGTSGAIKQCMFRYRERLLMGDLKVEAHIKKAMGTEEGQRIVDVMKSDDFERGMEIELTASSVSVNKDADRQNAILLVNLLAGYYEKTLQIMMVASNPQTPPPVAETARKIAIAASEIIERTIRTFDQVRDPATFIIDTANELDQTRDITTTGLQGLSTMLAGLSAPNGNGLPPGSG